MSDRKPRTEPRTEPRKIGEGLSQLGLAQGLTKKKVYKKVKQKYLVYPDGTEVKVDPIKQKRTNLKTF